MACLLFRDCGDPITICFLRMGMMLQVGCLDLIKNPGENLQHLPSLRRLRVLYQHHGWLDLCRCEFQRRRWVQKNNGTLSRNLTWNLKKSPIKKRKNPSSKSSFLGFQPFVFGGVFSGIFVVFLNHLLNLRGFLSLFISSHQWDFQGPRTMGPLTRTIPIRIP